MILPPYLESEVKKYCQVKNITLIRGNVPRAYLPEIKQFIGDKLKNDRQITKSQEKDKEFLIKTIINKCKGTLSSPIEDYLEDGLVRANMMQYFKRQVKIGTKTVDFACHRAQLVVECDGKQYHHTEKSQIERDQKRDKYLAKRGWRVLHIEGFAIRRNINLCMEHIGKAIKPFIIQ